MPDDLAGQAANVAMLIGILRQECARGEAVVSKIAAALTSLEEMRKEIRECVAELRQIRKPEDCESESETPSKIRVN